MEKYDNYKDSGIEWIGEIPEHWERTRLAYNGDFYKGKGISKSELSTEGLPVILYGDIYTKYNHRTEKLVRRIPEELAEKSFKIKQGDLLLAASGETPEDIGKCVCYIGKEYAYASGDVIVYRQNKNNPNFLSYLLNSYKINEQKAKLSKGEIVVHIYSTQLRNIYFGLPTPEEQTAIANYLDRKTTEIDELIADKKRLLELYEEEKTAIINELVTGKKVWNGNAWTEPAEVKDSGIEWLGEIPEHWEVKKVKHVLKSLNSIRVPLSADERGKMLLRKYDYYGASGVIDKVEDYLFDEPLLLIGEDGANLVTRSTRLSFIARGKYWVNNHAHILKPTYGLLEYYCELMEICDYSIWISGSAQPKLTSENLMNIQVIVPPIEEQKAIVRHIETECALIDAKSEKTKKLIDLLTEYRTALISEVVTGKIKVTG